MRTDTTERPTPTRERTESSSEDADRGGSEFLDAGSSADRSSDAEGTDPVVDPNPPPPAWFRTKPAPPSEAAGPTIDTAAAPSRSPVVPPVESPPPRLHPPRSQRVQVAEPSAAATEPADWRRRAALWVTGFAGTGYGLSLLLHSVLLVVLGLVVLDVSVFGPAGAAQLGFSEDDGDAFDFGAADSIHQEAGGRDAAEEPVEPLPVSQVIAAQGDPVEKTREQVEQFLPSDVPSSGAGEGVEQGDGTAEQAGGGRKIGSNAVQSADGTFTIYVTPARDLAPGENPEGFDPEPNEAYFTYIFIALPKDVDHLRYGDIEGRIDGNDGWETRIPYDVSRRKVYGPVTLNAGTKTFVYNPNSAGVPYFPIEERLIKQNKRMPVATRRVDGEIERFVVLRLLVPPAGREGIKDTIRIECKPLGKQARLEVEF
jgi:hypothetical protein